MSFSQITRADRGEIRCARLSVHDAGRGCTAPCRGLWFSSTARVQQQQNPSQGLSTEHNLRTQHQHCSTAHFIPSLLPGTPPRSITELFYMNNAHRRGAVLLLFPFAVPCHRSGLPAACSKPRTSLPHLLPSVCFIPPSQQQASITDPTLPLQMKTDYPGTNPPIHLPVIFPSLSCTSDGTQVGQRLYSVQQREGDAKH